MGGPSVGDLGGEGGGGREQPHLHNDPASSNQLGSQHWDSRDWPMTRRRGAAAGRTGLGPAQVRGQALPFVYKMALLEWLFSPSPLLVLPTALPPGQG